MVHMLRVDGEFFSCLHIFSGFQSCTQYFMDTCQIACIFFYPTACDKLAVLSSDLARSMKVEGQNERRRHDVPPPPKKKNLGSLKSCLGHFQAGLLII